MADSTTPSTDLSRPPALPSTADTVPYVPVSWMAVGAGAVASLFLIVVLVSGYSAYKSRRPMINAPELLFSLAAVTVLLSFAARRLIRDADGTRTGNLFGINLPTFSWWVGLIGFLGYGAYFVGIEYSIQREAKAEVEKWIGFVQKGEMTRGFHRTLEPGRRGGIGADDTKRMQDEFKEPLLAFTNSDLMRLTQRNAGECKFIPGGLRDWVYKDSGIECLYTGTIECPEGRFPVRIPLKAYESTIGSAVDGGNVGRQWQVIIPQNGFFQRDDITLTPYGWMVLMMEAQGNQRASEFLSITGGTPVIRPYFFHEFVMRDGDPSSWVPRLDLNSGGNSIRGDYLAFGGAPVIAHPYTPEYQKALAEFLRLPNGNPPGPKELAKFVTAWNEGRGMIPSGGILRTGAEMNSTILVTPSGAVEVRLPVELPELDMSASRGRLVVECTDPQVMEEIKRLRASADPNQSTKMPPDELKNRYFTWKVARLESDMVPIKPQGPTGGPGGAPPMPAPPGRP